MASKKPRKPKKQQRVSERRLAQALRANGGVQARAADKIGITRGAVCLRVAQSDVLKQAMEEGRQVLLDDAEHNVTKAIRRRAFSEPMTRWFLDRQGRDRGYGATHVLHEDITPRDPAYEMRRSALLAPFMRVLEEMAEGRHVEASMIDVTPARAPSASPLAAAAAAAPAPPQGPKPNGKGNNGHG